MGEKFDKEEQELQRNLSKARRKGQEEKVRRLQERLNESSEKKGLLEEFAKEVDRLIKPGE